MLAGIKMDIGDLEIFEKLAQFFRCEVVMGQAFFKPVQWN